MVQTSKFVREYLLRSYECDRNGTLRIVALMNIFQDIADSHAEMLGIGMEHCLKHGLAWVGTNYHVKIGRMPAWHEKIKVTTWPSAEKKIAAPAILKYLMKKATLLLPPQASGR